MRYKLLGALVFISCAVQAQQINPVPDYVFQNRMSVGRTTVTDTLAYFSMGPRYGAIRGFMPPMVVDTALVTGGTKRNGLTIFSIQKNKYVYWDSVGSKWAEMAGTGGSAITGTGAAGYMSEFTTSTNLDSTTLYHSAGRFAIGSTSVSNGRFSVFGGQAYFDTSLKVGSQTFLADEGKNEVYVNTTSDAGAYALQVAGSIYNTTGAVFAASSGSVGIGTTNPTQKLVVSNAGSEGLEFVPASSANTNAIQSYNRATSAWNTLITRASIYNIQIGTSSAMYIDASSNVGINTSTPSTKLTVGDRAGNATYQGDILINQFANAINQSGGLEIKSDGSGSGFGYRIQSLFDGNSAYDFTIQSRTNSATWTERVRITSAGELLIGTTTDAGAYALQVAGAIYNTTTLTTGAPTSGTAKPWRLGEAATVSPTSPNRTIRVEIDGTVYYIHAKTTND